MMPDPRPYLSEPLMRMILRWWDREDGRFVVQMMARSAAMMDRPVALPMWQIGSAFPAFIRPGALDSLDRTWPELDRLMRAL